jgi:RNA polymerase sigma factor (sigma-70 family)
MRVRSVDAETKMTQFFDLRATCVNGVRLLREGVSPMSQFSADAGSPLPEVMDDAIALQRFVAQGDPVAFRALTQRYQSMVFASCRRVLKSQADAEDAAQETFLKFTRAAASIRGNVAAWLHACAVGTATDLLRRKTTRERVEREAAVEAVGASNAVESLSEEQRTWKELEPMLDAALAQLVEADRDAIVGHFLVGRSQKDLAREAGVSAGTMSRRMDEALANLAGLLRGVSPSLGGAAALAAALGFGAKTASASPVLGASLAKVGLLETALSGKSVATKAGLLSTKGVLVGAAAMLVLAGSAAVLTMNAGASKQVPAAMIAAAAGQVQENGTPDEVFVSVPRPTKESDPFTMSSQIMAARSVDVFELTVDANKFTFLHPVNVTGERGTIAADRVRDKDVLPASEGKQGTLALRITKFTISPDGMIPDATGNPAALEYKITNNLMRGKLTNGTESINDELVWRRDPNGAVKPDPSDPAVGSWTQVPVWWSLRFQKDSIELCGGEERWVMQRYRIISWTEENGMSKVETMCVDNYVEKSLIGKRVKLLLRKTTDAKYQVARWEPDSPKINEWPTFSPKKDEQIRIFTFMKEIK